MTDGQVLVVGYGNPLRSDDGVGWHAAGRLARDPRLAGAEVLARHQLTPELAEDVAGASLVVLVDASAGQAAGSVSVAAVEPRPVPVPAWSHHLEPAALAGLAVAVYGRAPPVVVVSVGAASFDGGDRLSPAVEAALGAVADEVARVVAAPPRPPGRAATGQATSPPAAALAEVPNGPLRPGTPPPRRGRARRPHP